MKDRRETPRSGLQLWMSPGAAAAAWAQPARRGDEAPALSRGTNRGVRAGQPGHVRLGNDGKDPSCKRTEGIRAVRTSFFSRGSEKCGSL